MTLPSRVSPHGEMAPGFPIVAECRDPGFFGTEIESEASSGLSYSFLLYRIAFLHTNVPQLGRYEAWRVLWMLKIPRELGANVSGVCVPR